MHGVMRGGEAIAGRTGGATLELFWGRQGRAGHGRRGPISGARQPGCAGDGLRRPGVAAVTAGCRPARSRQARRWMRAGVSGGQARLAREA